MKRFESIINTAIKESMSDIHITGEHPVVTRKLGDIQFHGSLKWTHQEIDDLIKKLLTPLQLETLRYNKSVDVSLSVSNARLRVNVFTTMRGISIAIRLLPGHIPTIEELNLHPSLHEISKIKSGLVLICGGTGEGKTTTIAAIINDINKARKAHIVTLEDPVEFRFSSKKSFIEQREIGSHTTSFEQGLLDVLREDADVIVVGELREGETMRLALNAAESGHLVIATMHAANPEEAIYRMCNAVPVEAQTEVRNQLASTLAWVTVQQLVFLEKAGQRVPVLAIIHGTPPIKNTIRDNKLHHINNIVETSKDEGMFTSERYLTYYLKNRSTFSPYGNIFRPLEELSQNNFYQSPLTEASYMKHAAKQPMKTASQPINAVPEYSEETDESALNIKDNISLDRLVEKLNKDSK